MNQQTAKKLINKTRDDYNLIADQFASTRKYNWPDVEYALAVIFKNFDKKKKIRVLDAGCGAGRVRELFKNHNVDYFGIDISEKLVDIAKQTYHEENFLVGDITNLPYADNYFDIVVTIATIHHIPTKMLRDKAIEEIYRVTKPGGWVLIDTWYFWTKPVFVSMIFKSLFTKNNLSFGDFYRPWKDSKGGIKTERYFHAWRKRELTASINNVGFQNISTIKNKYGFTSKRRNLEIIAQKPE